MYVIIQRLVCKLTKMENFIVTVLLEAIVFVSARLILLKTQILGLANANKGFLMIVNLVKTKFSVWSAIVCVSFVLDLIKTTVVIVEMDTI